MAWAFFDNVSNAAASASARSLRSSSFSSLRLFLRSAVSCALSAEVLPAPGQPTSHILKPAIHRFEQPVDNEYYCLSFARATGLDVKMGRATWRERVLQYVEITGVAESSK